MYSITKENGKEGTREKDVQQEKGVMMQRQTK